MSEKRPRPKKSLQLPDIKIFQYVPIGKFQRRRGGLPRDFPHPCISSRIGQHINLLVCEAFFCQPCFGVNAPRAPDLYIQLHHFVKIDRFPLKRPVILNWVGPGSPLPARFSLHATDGERPPPLAQRRGRTVRCRTLARPLFIHTPPAAIRNAHHHSATSFK